MKRVHFDSKGPVKWHYYFWQPWGCFGCLWRSLLFMVLLAIFLFLLSQFRSCSDTGAPEPVADQPVSVVVPPINEDDIIDDGGHQVVANRLNVLFDAETGEAEHQAWIERFNELYPGNDYQILFFDPNTKLMSIQVPAEERTQMIEQLPEQIPDIPFLVFEESVMDMGLHPNDPVFRHEDHAGYFGLLDIYNAWDITQGSPSTIVSVVDSYFDLANVEFANTAIMLPYSVGRGDSIVALPSDYSPDRPNPVYAHGTMVSGLIFSAVGNGRASAGIAPQCTFMPVSLGARFGCLAMLQGILYSLNHYATVINISAGLSLSEEVSAWPVEAQIEASRTELLGQERVWQYVFEMAQRNFVTIVWAAGNEDVFTAIDASKRGDNTIKVSAVDNNMHKADFSNFGNFPNMQIEESTVSAPGVQIPCLVAGREGYMLVDGTSFSAPIVAGAVGLIKSVDPTLSTAEIINVLKSTGTPATGSTTIGPVVNIGHAVSAAESSTMNYDAFSNSIARGSGDNMRLCALFYSESGSNALAPIYTIDFKSTSAGRGQVVYTSNRSGVAPLIANYNVTERDANHIKIHISATPQGEVSFGEADIEFVPNSRGKASLQQIRASWWDIAAPGSRIKLIEA